jgi:hypothetical protein
MNSFCGIISKQFEGVKMSEIEEFNKEKAWEDYETTLNHYIPILKSKSEPLCYDTFYFVGHERQEFKVVNNDWQYFVLGSVARFLSANGFLEEEIPNFMIPNPNILEDFEILNGNDLPQECYDINYSLKDFEIQDLLTENFFDKWRTHFIQDVEWWMK